MTLHRLDAAEAINQDARHAASDRRDESELRESIAAEIEKLQPVNGVSTSVRLGYFQARADAARIARGES